MTFSSIKNLSVFSITLGSFLGAVDSIYVDKTSREVVYISCNDYLITPENINGVNDIIIATDEPKSRHAIDPTPYFCLKADSPLYDCKGAKLADSFDYPLSSSYKNQRVLSADSNSYDIDKIVLAAEIILINTGRQLPSQKKGNARSAVTTPTNTAIANSTTPDEGEYAFLLGRTIKRAILDINGNTIVKAGSVVTSSIIDTAKKSGKLIELVTISRR